MQTKKQSKMLSLLSALSIVIGLLFLPVITASADGAAGNNPPQTNTSHIYADE